MRFFAANENEYEQARVALDTVWGLPNDRGTVTCIAPSTHAPRDAQGRVILATSEEFCQYPAASQMLEYMLGLGAVVAITRSEYMAAFERPFP